MEKETIEEAVKRLTEGHDDLDSKYSWIEGFEKGAKWQEERMYSEEEVADLFRKYQYDLAQWVLRMEDDIDGKPIPTEWFKKFKKK